MYYFREVIGGQWKALKNSEQEVESIIRLTTRKGLKVLAIVKDEIVKSGTQVTPAETLVMFQKAAPTYQDLAVDRIRHIEWKRNHPDVPKAAPEAAQQTTEAASK